MRNNEFAVHYLGGMTERQTLSTVLEICDALQDVFRLTLPGTPDLDIAPRKADPPTKVGLKLCEKRLAAPTGPGIAVHD